jgi:hypothetical protein
MSLNRVDFDDSVTESDGQQKKEILALQRGRRFFTRALV